MKKEPSLNEFYALIEQAHETTKKIGLTQQDIDKEIKKIRAENAIDEYFSEHNLDATDIEAWGKDHLRTPKR